MQKNTDENSWAGKTDEELRDFIKQGVAEINIRAKDKVARTERQLINDISKMQGVENGEISDFTEGIHHKELIYRARKIDRFLKLDTSSKRGIAQLNDISEEARMSFNEANKGVNLSRLQYREMVELMGAFKDGTQNMGSEQIQDYFENAIDKITANELAHIFAEAEEKKEMNQSQRMDWIYKRIDELRGM